MSLSKVFVTGDTHGSDFTRFSSSNWQVGTTLTKHDYVIILGDFGLLWNNETTKQERYWKDWLDSKPWTTLVCLGNHESYDLIENLPTIDYLGGKVYDYTPSIKLLQTGEVYTINNKTFLNINGGLSIDRGRRVEGVSWWPQEQITHKQIEYTLDKCETLCYSIDYVISHDGPRVHHPMTVKYHIDNGHTRFLDELEKRLTYKHWYFGHFHEYQAGSKGTCLYTEIERVL